MAIKRWSNARDRTYLLGPIFAGLHQSSNLIVIKNSDQISRQCVEFEMGFMFEKVSRRNVGNDISVFRRITLSSGESFNNAFCTVHEIYMKGMAPSPIKIRIKRRGRDFVLIEVNNHLYSMFRATDLQINRTAWPLNGGFEQAVWSRHIQ